MAAESLQYTDPYNASKCMDALYKLQERFRQRHESRHWMVTLFQALANVHVKQQEWRLALSCLDAVLYGRHHDDDNDKTFLEGLVEWEYQHNRSIALNQKEQLLSAYKVEICTRQLRILLQIGALEQARVIMDQAQQEATKALAMTTFITQNIWLDPRRIRAQLAMNQGLLQFARQDYESAMAFYKKAVDELREQPFDDDDDDDDSDLSKLLTYSLNCPLGLEHPSELLSHCWNNVALCSLNLCQMKEAVRMMESLVRASPTKYLTEGLAFNLATLYELGADTAVSSKRKRVLQLVAKRFSLHDIGAEYFRVT
jgi:tetratricopeptide (TPR) repeat protein